MTFILFVLICSKHPTVHGHQISSSPTNLYIILTSLQSLNSVAILYLHKNSQTVKKVWPMQKKAAWKKLWNQRWWPRSGCGLIMAKILIASIQVNLCSTGNQHQKFTWIKNFAIIRPPQPLLGRHLWFHNFFHAAFFCMGRTFFYSLAVLV